MNEGRVVDSLENRERDRCVDIFVREDGSFGFQEWRREPEDPGCWYRTGYHSHAVFADAKEARRAARAAVPWLAPAGGGSA